MEALSETRLELVHPIVGIRVRALETALGFPLRVTQGFRRPPEQLALWSQGRFSLEIVNSRRHDVQWAPLEDRENVRTVTNAPVGHSWHEYGLCVDVVPMLPQPDFNETHPQWEQIITRAREFKLLDGISFHDSPHLQPLELPISPTPKFQQLLISGNTNMQDIWNMVGLSE